MNRAEAIKILSSYDVNGVWADVDGKPYNAEEQAEAFDMAIEALKGEQLDEWCTDCKEYDMEKKCCPRFNRVIRGAMNREPSEDGTLEVKVEDATKIGRVLVSDNKHRGGLYYPDEDEPKGDDLISRADAIEALGEEPLVWCDDDAEIAERNQWRADVEAIESVPSADRPMVIKCKPFLSEEDFKAFAEQVSDQNVILIPYEAEVVSTNISTKSTNISTDTSADRPRGEWTLLAEERPVDDYEIIATVYWPEDGDSIMAIGHIDRFDNWHLYDPTGGELIKGFEVIAWMPLPELYKESDAK